MAHELIRHNVSCRLIDKLEAPVQQSRATDLQPRTLEIFEDMGVIDEVSSRAHKLRSMNVFSAPLRKLLVRIDFTVLDTPFPHMFGISQAETEKSLTISLERVGGKIERGVEFQGFEQHDDGVTTTLRHPDGTVERVRSRWVIGCDGSHSPVRHELGLPFPGIAYPEMYWVADVTLDWEMPEDDLYVFLSNNGYYIILSMPEPGKYRVMIDLDPEDETDPNLEVLQSLFDERVHFPGKLSDPTWMSQFRIHRRLVPNYRVGNVFLAGDSAHIHSPMNGQGINVGIQDAYNLAWKLGLVRHGHARAELLDTYEEERRPIGEFICMDTERTNKIMLMKNRLGTGIRDTLTPLLLGVKQINKKVAQAFSELDLHYRGSSIVGEKHTPIHMSRLSHSNASETASLGDRRAFKRGPTAGDRAPDVKLADCEGNSSSRVFEHFMGTHHTLLLFDGTAATAEGYKTLVEIAETVRARYSELVRTYIVIPMKEAPPALKWDGAIIYDADMALHNRFGSRAESLYLIRPDLYVGFRSQPAELEPLLEHLERYLSARAAPGRGVSLRDGAASVMERADTP